MIEKDMIEAIEKFLEDHHIENSGCSSVDIHFEWISANITFAEMHLLEKEFGLSLGSFYLNEEKLEDVSFSCRRKKCTKK